MKTEWSKYIQQKRAKGYLDKDEKFAMRYIRPVELLRRLNARKWRDFKRSIKRVFGCSN